MPQSSRERIATPPRGQRQVPTSSLTGRQHPSFATQTQRAAPTRGQHPLPPAVAAAAHAHPAHAREVTAIGCWGCAATGAARSPLPVATAGGRGWRRGDRGAGVAMTAATVAGGVGGVGGGPTRPPNDLVCRGGDLAGGAGAGRVGGGGGRTWGVQGGERPSLARGDCGLSLWAVVVGGCCPAGRPSLRLCSCHRRLHPRAGWSGELGTAMCLFLPSRRSCRVGLDALVGRGSPPSSCSAFFSGADNRSRSSRLTPPNCDPRTFDGRLPVSSPPRSPWPSSTCRPPSSPSIVAHSSSRRSFLPFVLPSHRSPSVHLLGPRLSSRTRAYPGCLSVVATSPLRSSPSWFSPRLTEAERKKHAGWRACPRCGRRVSTNGRNFMYAAGGWTGGGPMFSLPAYSLAFDVTGMYPSRCVSCETSVWELTHVPLAFPVARWWHSLSLLLHAVSWRRSSPLLT